MSLPTVSVVLCAYNYEVYVTRALESALAQDYPAELLEIVVINDGSTDSTADVVEEIAARHPGRVRVVHQANAGYIAATNRGLAESRGELIALLDADDVWRADKTRRQVEMFEADPTLGLVFSDMTVVDGDEAVLRPSKLIDYGPISENRLAALLFENFATTSSIMVRSSLREAYAPVPAHVPFADWWIALHVAQRAGLDYVREPLALYRMHGSNMTNGATGSWAVRENRRAIGLQLWALRNAAARRAERGGAAARLERDRAPRAHRRRGGWFVLRRPAGPRDGGRHPSRRAPGRGRRGRRRWRLARGGTTRAQGAGLGSVPGAESPSPARQRRPRHRGGRTSRPAPRCAAVSDAGRRA